MWTAENRARYDHRTDRYPLDMTDEEWQLVEPLLLPLRKNQAGRRRELLNAILYVLHTGCKWRQLPKDFPPRSTTHDYFIVTAISPRYITYSTAPAGSSLKRQPHQRLLLPTASVLNRQKKGQHIDSAGFDAGKKVKGKKQRLLCVPCQGALFSPVKIRAG